MHSRVTKINVPKLMVSLKLAPSLSEAIRLIEAGVVAFDGNQFKGVFMLLEILKEPNK